VDLEKIQEKYGNVKLKFSGYYKYSFSFTGKTDDGEEIYASIGGNADDIYRLPISSEETINSLEPNYIKVSKDGEKIVDWNNW